MRAFISFFIILMLISSHAYAEYYLTNNEVSLPPYQPASKLPHSTHHGKSWLNIYIAYPCPSKAKWLANHVKDCKVNHYAPLRFSAFQQQPPTTWRHTYHYQRYEAQNKRQKDQGFDDMSTGDDVRYHSDLEIND